MKHSVLILVLLAAVLPVTLTAVAADIAVGSKTAPTGQLDPSLRNEVTAAIDRSLTWLATKQRKDGAWSNDMFPARSWRQRWRRRAVYRPPDADRVDDAAPETVGFLHPRPLGLEGVPLDRLPAVHARR